MRQAPTRQAERPAHTRSRRVSFVVAALVGVAAGVVAVSRAGATLIVSRPIGEPDAVIALASHEWERLPMAADLARQSQGTEVWLTVPTPVTRHNCYQCAERVAWLEEAGIARERVTVLPERVTNTHDEAKAAADFVRQHPIDRLVVVTSPYHGRRSLATFRHVFAAAGVTTDIGIVTPVAGVIPDRWWRRQYDRDYVAYEWAAIASYAIRFGVPPFV